MNNRIRNSENRIRNSDEEKWTARDMAYRPGGLPQPNYVDRRLWKFDPMTGKSIEQPEQEPVAWMVVNGKGKIEDVSHYKPSVESWLKYDATRRLIPLYTAPRILCGCGDQIMPDDGAECGNCVTARNAVK